mgnify:CR=1 FL=1
MDYPNLYICLGYPRSCSGDELGSFGLFIIDGVIFHIIYFYLTQESYLSRVGVSQTECDILLQMNPAGSFFRFTLGFLTFVSLSIIITYAVNVYEISQSAEEQTASAIKAMLEYKK